MTCADTGSGGSKALSELIRALPFPGGDQKASVSDITRDMDTLAHNLVIFLLAALGVIPAPPGTSALIGVPLMIVAVQKALHLPLKLPGPVMRARLSRSRFEGARTRILSWLSSSESFVTPRPGWHHRRSANVMLDWSVVALSIGMLIPLPLTAMLPVTCPLPVPHS